MNAVINVISPKLAAVYKYNLFLIFSFKFNADLQKALKIMNEKTAPNKLETANDTLTEERRITFFIKTASIAENMSAKNQYNMSF